MRRGTTDCPFETDWTKFRCRCKSSAFFSCSLTRFLDVGYICANGNLANEIELIENELITIRELRRKREKRDRTSEGGRSRTSAELPSESRLCTNAVGFASTGLEWIVFVFFFLWLHAIICRPEQQNRKSFLAVFRIDQQRHQRRKSNSCTTYIS